MNLMLTNIAIVQLKDQDKTFHRVKSVQAIHTLSSLDTFNQYSNLRHINTVELGCVKTSQHKTGIHFTLMVPSRQQLQHQYQTKSGQ
jgi:hypothetical protein